MAPDTTTWLKLAGAFIGIGYAAGGVFWYVWKDDRKRLEGKLDKEDFNTRYTNDVQEIKKDVREIRGYILGKHGE